MKPLLGCSPVLLQNLPVENDPATATLLLLGMLLLELQLLAIPPALHHALPN